MQCAMQDQQPSVFFFYQRGHLIGERFTSNLLDIYMKAMYVVFITKPSNLKFF